MTAPGTPEQQPERLPERSDRTDQPDQAGQSLQPERAGHRRAAHSGDAPASRRWTAILFALLALGVGIAIGLLTSPTVPDWIAPYLPIAVVAALDALFGALRAFLQRVFDAKVFVVSFVGNVLVAALIVFLGDQLGVGSQLSTAVVVVLGIRIFANVAAIRREVFHA